MNCLDILEQKVDQLIEVKGLLAARCETLKAELKQAAAIECAACARVCDKLAMYEDIHGDTDKSVDQQIAYERAAAAIRKRGDHDN